MQAVAAAQAVGSIMSGFQQKQMMDAEAKNLELQGVQEGAASQRPAELALKQGELVASRQRAVSSASGAGATDPTVQNIEADTSRNAEYNALTALYEGKSAAASLDYQARMDRFAGTQALIGGIIGAAGKAGASSISNSDTIGSGGKSFFDQYGLPFDQWNIGG